MTLADQVIADAPASAIAQALPEAGRFILDRNVTAAIDKFIGDPMALHRAIGWARLPFPATWIEMEARAASGRNLRIGYLIEAAGTGFSVEVAMQAEITSVLPGAARVDASGIKFRSDTRAQDRDIFALAGGYALRFLLLLNARNRVVAIAAAPDLSRLNRARRKRGKPELLAASTVTLDLSRPLMQAERRGHGRDRAAIEAHLVRGHFKLRKTGVFWWSPFARSGYATPKTYAVTARGEP
jgi:hypothetical protein